MKKNIFNCFFLLLATFIAQGAATDVSVVFSKSFQQGAMLEIVCESRALPSISQPSAVAPVPDTNNAIDINTGLPLWHTIQLSTPEEKSNFMEGIKAAKLAYATDSLNPVRTNITENPDLANFYYPVLSQNGRVITNRVFGFEANYAKECQISFLDASLEDSAAVYLYLFHEGIYTNLSGGMRGRLFLTRVLDAHDRKTVQRKDRVLWEPLEGSYSEIRGAHLVGSHERGTLAVEIDSLRGSHTIITNRLIDGKWVETKSAPTK